MISEQDLTCLINDNTDKVSPRLIPEITLSLATEDLPIWRMGEDELQALGLGTPFWAFAWAGGQALARYILDHPETVKDKCVLDFGSGSGLVAIAAAMAGAKSVIANDIDPICQTVIAKNARNNQCDLVIETRDLTGDDEPVLWDMLLIGDVCYDKETAELVLPWAHRQKAKGVPVLIGDPGRFYLPKLGLEPIARYSCETTSLMEDSDLRNAQVWQLQDGYNPPQKSQNTHAKKDWNFL